MVGYPDAMFNYLQTAAATSLTQMFAGIGTTAGPYTVQADGTLVAIDVWCTPQAATSLAQSGRIELTCTTFTPINKLVFWIGGFGLATAPQVYGGNQSRFTFPVNQPVKTVSTIVAYHLFYASPVTPNLQIEGWFTSP